MTTDQGTRAGLIRRGVVLAIAVVVPQLAFADCVRIPPREMIRLMPVAFGGRLVAQTDVGGSGYELVFDVSRVWKGNVSRRQTLYQVQSIEMAHLETGKEYVTFARPIVKGEADQLQLDRRSRVLVMPACSLDVLVATDRDFHGLGPGRVPR